MQLAYLWDFLKIYTCICIYIYIYIILNVVRNPKNSSAAEAMFQKKVDAFCHVGVDVSRRDMTDDTLPWQ